MEKELQEQIGELKQIVIHLKEIIDRDRKVNFQERDDLRRRIIALESNITYQPDVSDYFTD